MEDNEEGLTSIKDFKKLTSGLMAANSHFHVTDEEVYNFLIRQQQEVKKKQSVISKKQSKIEKKKRKQWLISYRKWYNDDKLYSKDYKALLGEMLMAGDVMPKNVSGLRGMFERPEYQERLMEMGCEVPDSDDESTSTFDSILSTGTCTSENMETMNNGEQVNLTELDLVEVSVTDLPANMLEHDQNVPGGEGGSDCNSVVTTVTAVLLHDIRCPWDSSVNISHTFASTTDNDRSQDSMGVTFLEETSESTAARLLAGLRSDTEVHV